jgi:hypothetical protein
MVYELFVYDAVSYLSLQKFSVRKNKDKELRK